MKNVCGVSAWRNSHRVKPRGSKQSAGAHKRLRPDGSRRQARGTSANNNRSRGGVSGRRRECVQKAVLTLFHVRRREDCHDQQ